jgi:ABC-type oligopeptide transport system ATPase subunit
MGKPLNSASEVEVKKARRYLRYIGEENFSGLTNEPKNRLDNLLYSMVDRYPNPDGKAGGRAFALELLKRVGLNEDMLERFPTQISGGQRQRYAIARALATRPRLVIADEPVSNLDLDSRTQVLNLMRRLGRENGTSFLFISHDPSMVRYFADQGRTAVMFAGRIMEVIPTSQLFDQPTHPYTRTLLEVNSTPGPLPGAALNPAQEIAEAQKRLAETENTTLFDTLEGAASDLSLGGNITAAAQLVAANRPGCPYYRWCPERIELCQTERPKLATVVRRRNPNSGEYLSLAQSEINPQHKAACIHYYESNIEG